MSETKEEEKVTLTAWLSLPGLGRVTEAIQVPDWCVDSEGAIIPSDAVEFVEEWFSEELQMEYGACVPGTEKEHLPEEPSIRDMRPEAWVHFLEYFLDQDPDALTALIDSRVPCNEVLAADPYIQVRKFETDPEPLVGFLGLLNGFLHPQGYQVQAVYNDTETPTLKGFTCNKI